MLMQSGLYAMSLLNKGLDLSIRNCYIEPRSGQDARLRSIRYGHLEHEVAPFEHRDRWRDDVLRALFADHLTPLWQGFAREAPIPLAILWENTAIYIYVLYEQVIAAISASAASAVSMQEQFQRCQDDFHYIMQAAEGEVFGLRRNPLAAYYHGSLAPSTESPSVRKRKTCCYYFEIDNIRGYCKSCPLR